jgi:hypothetical protein
VGDGALLQKSKHLNNEIMKIAKNLVSGGEIILSILSSRVQIQPPLAQLGKNSGKR